jgi:hypothetical protein
VDASAPIGGAGSDRENAMNTATQTVPTLPLSRINKAGLAVAGLLGLLDIASPLMATPEGEVGPPFPILVLDAVLGVITVVAVVIAWRTARRGLVRVAAGARIISALTAFPAFFVDVPVGLKVGVGIFVLVTAVSVAMMLAPTARTRPVTD